MVYLYDSIFNIRNDGNSDYYHIEWCKLWVLSHRMMEIVSIITFNIGLFAQVNSVVSQGT